MQRTKCHGCGKIIDNSMIIAYEYGKVDKPEYPKYRVHKVEMGGKTIEESGYVCSPKCDRVFTQEFVTKYGLQQAKQWNVETDPRVEENATCDICGKRQHEMSTHLLKYEDVEEQTTVCSIECEVEAKRRFLKKQGLARSEEQEYPEIISTIAEYTSESYPSVIKKLEKGPQLVAEEWKRTNPTSAEEKIQFYKECENYIYDLGAWHMSGHKQMDQQITAMIVQQGAKRVVDYGAGIGDNAIHLARAGIPEIYAVDLVGKTQEFARYRINKLELDDKITIVPLDEPFEGYDTGKEWLSEQEVDAILCLDVLEHLDSHNEVKKTVRWLKSISNNIIATLPLGTGGGSHPMHLTEDPKLKRWVEEQGVRLLY